MHAAVPDFPVSVSTMILWAVLLTIVGLFFVQFLLHLNRKGHRKLIGLTSWRERPSMWCSSRVPGTP